MLPPQQTARMAAATKTTARTAIAMPRHHATGNQLVQRRPRHRCRRIEPPWPSSSSSSSSTATFSVAPGSSTNLIAANLTSWLVARGAMPPSERASVVLVTATIYVMLNLVADILYVLINPRLRAA